MKLQRKLDELGNGDGFLSCAVAELTMFVSQTWAIFQQVAAPYKSAAPELSPVTSITTMTPFAAMRNVANRDYCHLK